MDEAGAGTVSDWVEPLGAERAEKLSVVPPRAGAIRP